MSKTLDALLDKPVDVNYLRNWIGKEETDKDWVSPRVAAQMAGMLGWGSAPKEGEYLPIPWHWLFFNPVPLRDQTGIDGHPTKGGFYPPVPLPCRMWAGSQVDYNGNLRVGDAIKRVSRIASVDAKEGRSGVLVFVTVEHKIFNAKGKLVISENQDLVYKATPTIPYKRSRAAQRQNGPCPQWIEPATPDSVQLFRYSALTFNAHRIHYDRNYSMEQEHYPALVVQGPLIASLLFNSLYKRIEKPEVTRFSFRGVTPLFDGEQFTVEGCEDVSSVELRALNSTGQLAMSMTVCLLTYSENQNICRKNLL